MGTFYRSRHELIFAFKNGTAPHLNNFELGQYQRYRTNVWSYKGANSFGAGRMTDLALHPTVKPVQMIADAIKDVSERGAIVLDLFGGSGSGGVTPPIGRFPRPTREIAVRRRMRGGGGSRLRTSLLPNFPGNREKYREFAPIRPLSAL